MIKAAQMPFVRFETEVETVRDEDGHTQYRNKIMAYITSAGSKDEVVKVADEWIAQLREKSQTRGAFDAAANEYDQWYDRFSKLLQNYKDGLGMDHDGTPLRACLAFTPAEVAQCEAVKIFTIDALAVCNEEAIGRMGMGGRTLKQKAQKILETGDGAKVAEENAALRLKVEELTEKVVQLTALVGAEPKQRKQRQPKDDQD
ncbi:MAG: hypothetical protein WC236_15565 [Gallionellaceae bacterium]